MNRFQNPAPRGYVENSIERTTRWLHRCRAELDRLNALEDTLNPNQLLFAINQGGTYSDLRIRHMRQIAQVPAAGYAIGGLAVGETADEMYDIIEAVEPYMPKDKPRYLMGVGIFSVVCNNAADSVQSIHQRETVVQLEVLRSK